jgi:hypothetical protein
MFQDNSNDPQDTEDEEPLVITTKPEFAAKPKLPRKRQRIAISDEVSSYIS